MDKTPKISVIISVYNREVYLPKCLESICNQSTRNIEILCIDDGSNDPTREILKQYGRDDSRIKIFNHEYNKGCAAARNTGINNASGKYLYFIDSDDWIDEDYLKELLEIAESHNIPLVYNSNILLEKENDTSELFDPGNYGSSIGFHTRGYINCNSNIGNFAYSSCCCLYRRDYLKNLNIKFPEGLDYTDNYFHIATFIPQKEIFVTNKNAYHYRIHADSICTKNQKTMLNYDIIHVYEIILNYYIERGYVENCKLNFFELSQFVHRLGKTPEGYEQLRNLVKKSFLYINKNHNLYRDEELNFFNLIMESPDYQTYCTHIAPLLTKIIESKEELRVKRLRALREHILQNHNISRR